MPPRVDFSEHLEGNAALVSVLPFQSFHFTSHIKYVNLPVSQFRGPPEVFIHVLFIYYFCFYLHFSY